jgi:hypothetical protein
MVVLVYLFVTFELQITKKMQIQGQIIDIEKRRFIRVKLGLQTVKLFR